MPLLNPTAANDAGQHYVQRQVDHLWETIAGPIPFDAAVRRAQAERADGFDARIRSQQQIDRERAASECVCGNCGGKGHVWCNR